MNDHDKQPFMDAMYAAGVIFGKDIEAPFVRAYFQVLKPYQIGEVTAALDHLARSTKFFPKPAEIVEAITGGDTSIEEQALAAWMTFEGRLTNAYRSFDFEDKTINATCRALGGMVSYFDRFEQGDGKWYRKEFLKTYAQLSNRQLTERDTAPLRGLSEQVVRNGELVDAPVLKIACNYPLAPARVEHSKTVVGRVEPPAENTSAKLLKQCMELDDEQ